MPVRPTHFEFYSSDPEATVSMLTKAFGWQAEQWEDNDYWLLSTGEGAGIDGAVVGAGDRAPKTMLTCDVEDLEAAVEAAKVSGAALLDEIMEIPGVGRWARIQGPGGEVFGLMEPDQTD